MTRIAVAGGLFAGLAIAAVLLLIGRTGVLEACTGTAAFGWTVPIIAGLTIAAVAWALLGSSRVEDADEIRGISCECPACGESVIEGWRLCPYCGSMLGFSDSLFPEDAA